MPRAKPSVWQPKGIEVFDTCDLYSDDDLAKLIKNHFRMYNEKQTLKIRVQLRNIAGRLRAGLYYRKRPTHGEKREGLGIVAKATQRMLSVLEALDADTRRLLEDEADHSPDVIDIVIDGEQVGYQKKAVDLDIYNVHCSLKVFEKWIEAADKKLGSPKEPRKIKLDDERIAVLSLLTLWNRALGADPTIGPFTNFTNDVLMPVLKASNAETPLTGIISEELYGKKEPIKNTGTTHVPEK
jgi:hypothetical protein